LYALPRDICCWFIACNKDLFRREGVPLPRPDWTEEDFVRIGHRFVKDLDGDGRPDQFGIDWYPRDEAAIGGGGWFYDPEAWRATCQDPPYVRAMTFMRDIIWKTQVAPDASRGQLQGFGNAFMAGRVAMEAAGPWSFHNLRAECTFDWDIVPTPRGRLGRVNTLLGQPIAISARTRHFAEAYRALKFLCYSEVAQKRQAKEGIALPSRWDLAASYYRTLKTNPPSIDLFLDALGRAKAVPVGPADSEVLAALDPGYELIQLNLAQPQAEMDRVGKRIQRILDRRARVERRARR
jgi:multiple sugar transport system substrate-binding protein